MKTYLLIFSIFITSLISAQPAQENMTSYLNISFGENPFYDTNYHVKLKEGKWAFFNKDSVKICPESADDYPSSLGFSFFKFQNEKGNFVFSPKSGKFLCINKDYSKYYSFYDMHLQISTISSDTLIKIGFYTVNFKNEILLPGDSYTEANVGKKIAVKSEIENYLEDPGQNWQEVDSSEYDDFTKEMVFIKKHKNNILCKDIYDEAYPIYDEMYFDNSSNFPSFDERIFMLKKNGKFGLVSSVGKVILPFEFSSIRFINQEHLMIFKHKPFFKARRNGKDEIYDTQGNYLFTNNDIELEAYFDPYGNFDYTYLEAFLSNKKGKKGLISLNGSEILPMKYDYYDLINFRGESNIEVKNKASFNVDCKSYPFNEYLLGFNKKSKLYDFYAPNGQFLNQFEIEYFENFNRNGYLTYMNNDKYGLIGPGACSVISPSSNYIDVFKGSRDIFTIDTDTTSYFINSKNERLFGNDIEGRFLDSSFALARKSGSAGIIDVKKSIDSLFWVIPPTYTNIELFSSQTFNENPTFKVFSNGKSGILTSENELLMPIKYDEINLQNSIIISKLENKYGLSVFKGKELLPHDFDLIQNFNYAFYIVTKNKLFILYNIEKRKFINEIQYEEIQLIKNNYKFILVKNNGKFGLINFEGIEILPTIYQSISYDTVSDEFECIKDKSQKDCFFLK